MAFLKIPMSLQGFRISFSPTINVTGKEQLIFSSDIFCSRAFNENYLFYDSKNHWMKGIQVHVTYKMITGKDNSGNTLTTSLGLP